MPEVLAGTATGLALSSACLIASTVPRSGFADPVRTATPIPDRRKIDIGAGGDPLGGDQAVEALAREDHDIRFLAARELRADGLRPVALRGTRSGRHLDAARLLEFRQQLLIGAGEAARDQ